MGLPARAHLESLLRARKLDVTLTSAHPLAPEAPATAPSGVTALDVRLGGGWPRGQVSELVGPRSSGRTWLMTRTVAAATHRGELAAVVDALDVFDPASVCSAEPVWPYLLWVRGHALSHGGQAVNRESLTSSAAMERVLDRAIKAAALILQAGGFGVVALDLGDIPLAAIRRLPFTTWLRLQRFVEGHDTVGLIVAQDSVGRSAQGITVRLTTQDEVAGLWHGQHQRSRRLQGLPARVRLGRSRWQVADDESFAIA
jgi:hypothetical protein